MNEQALRRPYPQTCPDTDNDTDWADILRRAATASTATRPRVRDRQKMQRTLLLVAAGAGVAVTAAGLVFGLNTDSTPRFPPRVARSPSRSPARTAQPPGSKYPVPDVQSPTPPSASH